ncbi:MAG: PSP1 domain-containing protein [Planctomycetota bacterium]
MSWDQSCGIVPPGLAGGREIARWPVNEQKSGGSYAPAKRCCDSNAAVSRDRDVMAQYVIRYGAMRLLGIFSAGAGQQHSRSTQVVVRTDRGLEAGEVLCEADDMARSWLRDPTEGQILRAMTPEDQNELQRIRQQAEREMETCQAYVDRVGLQMKLIDMEHIFGGERIIVYYLAENRVDFRELVRLLAGEFQTRIEMRQIGVRDEAKLLADYGDCGQAVCCNTHLVQMPPVSMKMAKMQKATLDPTKISGRCGRLKCCLRYEFDSYEQSSRGRPGPREDEDAEDQADGQPDEV